MTELETDLVLSAIRRGEDSLPKLRAATGLDYAKLHSVLHKLEFEWKSINSSETASGFQRFTPTPSEKGNGRSKGANQKEEKPIPTPPPQALKTTKAAVSARDATLYQRDAPYCAQCHSLCLFDGLDPEGRPHWRCKSCNLTFEGSHQVSEMAQIVPKEESHAPSHEELGPEEEDAIEDMRHRNVRVTLGDEEEAALALMRGDELSEDEARIAEEIDHELVKALDEVVESNGAHPELCGCGRDAKHSGRCSFRRAKYGDQTVKVANNGRPRVTVDLTRLEDLLANPEITMGNVYKTIGVKRNVIYYRKDHDAAFRAAFERGMERRRKATTVEHAKHGPFCEANCFPDLGHHRNCAYWKEAEARQIATARADVSETRSQLEQAKALPESLQESRQNITKIITNNGTCDGTEAAQPTRAQQVKPDISEDKIEVANPANKTGALPTTEPLPDFSPSKMGPKQAMAKERDIIPELSGQDTQMVTRQTEIHGSLMLREEVQLKVEEIAQWPAERIAEFFDAISKVVNIPARTFPTKIKRAWSKDFEDQSEEGIPALTMLYLVSMLHEGMEEHEKQAVWTLILYLKRVEAAAEAAREAKKGEQA